MAAYTRDPRWINSRFAGKDGDGNPIHRGQRVLYYPNGRRILSGDHAERAWREFCAAVADEDQFNS